MEPTAELIDELFIDKVIAARKRPIAEKLMAGPQLFAYGCHAGGYSHAKSRCISRRGRTATSLAI